MFEKTLSKPGAIGCTIIEALDGGLLFMYSTNDGKVFKKSFDSGRTFAEEWIVPLGTVTANSNLLRLADSRLMMPLKNKPNDPRAEKIQAGDFTVVFSADDGKTWGDSRPVNKKSSCFYLMNDRILRLSSGRILIPMGGRPEPHLLSMEQEAADWCGCFRSDNEGQTWEPSEWVKGATVSNNVAEPIAVELPDKRVKMFMRTRMGYLYESESDDGGMTWTQEHPTAIRMPQAPFTVKTDPFSGFLFIVWDHSFPSHISLYPRSPICLGVSRDGGEKWESIMELDSNPNQNYGYPSLYFKEDEILVTYYWNETRQFNTNLNQLKLRIFDRKELHIIPKAAVPLSCKH